MLIKKILRRILSIRIMGRVYNKLHSLYYKNRYLKYKHLPRPAKHSPIYSREPLVSVLMPIYNHADIAGKSIDSILTQTYKNIEVIILDDGSTDNLHEVLKKYKDNPKVRLYTQKNQKLPRALTHLHEFANGEFITWTSADNMMQKDMLKVLVKNLMSNPYADLVYGDVSLIGADGRYYFDPCRDDERDRKKPYIIRLTTKDICLSTESDNYINACFLYRKYTSNILMGEYKDDIIGAEDYDYWLRLNKHGELKHINNQKPLYFYRVHKNTMSYELQSKKIERHISRIENLYKYEKERQKYCNITPYVNITDISLKEKILESKPRILIMLSPDSQKTINIVTTENLENAVYFKYENNNYHLIDSVNKRDTGVSFFEGKDISPLAYKARNLYSRRRFTDSLSSVKKPIVGCHSDLSGVDISLLQSLLQDNKNIHFVLIDTSVNKQIQNLNCDNMIYFSNTPYGEAYKLYSNFSGVLALDTAQQMVYDSLILGWAIGRWISCPENAENINHLPFVNKYSSKININLNINKTDYEIMDKYIDRYSIRGCFEEVIKVYNCYTQEMYVKRPKYDVDRAPDESKPEPLIL